MSAHLRVVRSENLFLRLGPGQVAGLYVIPDVGLYLRGENLAQHEFADIRFLSLPSGTTQSAVTSGKR